MKIKYPGIGLIVILFVINCSSIYKSVIDKRDQNYREGVERYNQKKYEDARDSFNVVSNIEPDYKDTKKYLSILDRLINKKENLSQQKAAVNFNKGLSFMKSRRYEEALNCFLETKRDNPGHDSVDEKISECRKLLAPQFKEKMKLAVRYNKNRQYIQAYSACQKAVFFDPSNMEAIALRKNIEDKLEQLSGKYRAKGRELYSKKKYTEARRQFELALKNNPWDKESGDLLKKTDNRLSLDRYYNTAVSQYNAEDYFKARYSFNAVNDIEPGYKSTEQYLVKINSILNGQIGSIYNSGVEKYEKGEYQSAINEFNKVLSIDPENSMAVEYRQRSQAKLEIQRSLNAGS